MFDIKETTSGFFGALCCVYTGLPFDVVKLRLQTQVIMTTLCAIENFHSCNFYMFALTV